MKLFKTLILTTATLWTLTGCCWTDHSDTIKEVAEPMLVELKTFYEKNKRFPSIQERNEMLEKIGCNKIENDKCIYSGNTIDIERSRMTLNKEYDVLLTIENTYCFFGLDKLGNKLSVGCLQQPCIKFGQ